MNYNGITFETVEELIKYKEWELGKTPSRRTEEREAPAAQPVFVPQQYEPLQHPRIVRTTKYANSQGIIAACNKLQRKSHDITLPNILDELGIRKTKKAKKAVYKTVKRLVDQKVLHPFGARSTKRSYQKYSLNSQDFDAFPLAVHKTKSCKRIGQHIIVEALQSIGKPALLNEVVSALNMPQTKKSSQNVDALLRRLVQKKQVTRSGEKIFYRYAVKHSVNQKLEPKQYSDRHQQYLSFLSHAMKKYMNEPYRYNIEKARAIAAQEWETFKGTRTVHVPTKQFPQLTHVAQHDSELLIAMVKNVVGLHGRMKYDADGRMLNMESFTHWNDFVADFMQHSLQISEYFSVPNSFVTEMVGRTVEIAYR